MSERDRRDGIFTSEVMVADWVMSYVISCRLEARTGWSDTSRGRSCHVSWEDAVIWGRFLLSPQRTSVWLSAEL